MASSSMKPESSKTESRNSGQVGFQPNPNASGNHTVVGRRVIKRRHREVRHEKTPHAFLKQGDIDFDEGCAPDYDLDAPDVFVPAPGVWPDGISEEHRVIIRKSLYPGLAPERSNGDAELAWRLLKTRVNESKLHRASMERREKVLNHVADQLGYASESGSGYERSIKPIEEASPILKNLRFLPNVREALLRADAWEEEEDRIRFYEALTIVLHAENDLARTIAGPLEAALRYLTVAKPGDELPDKETWLEQMEDIKVDRSHRRFFQISQNDRGRRVIEYLPPLTDYNVMNGEDETRFVPCCKKSSKYWRPKNPSTRRRANQASTSEPVPKRQCKGKGKGKQPVGLPVASQGRARQATVVDGEPSNDEEEELEPSCDEGKQKSVEELSEADTDEIFER